MLRYAVHASALAAGLCASSDLCAAPLMWEPSLSFMTTYQNNPQYSVAATHYGSAEVMTLSAPVDWNNERSVFLFKPTLNAGESQGATGSGAHNKSLESSWVSAMDRVTWRLSGNYFRSDLFSNVPTDLGLVRPSGYSIAQYLDGGATLHLSELSDLQLDVSQSHSTFHNSGSISSFVNYHYTSANAQYSRAISERTKLLAVFSGGEYKPDVGPNVSNDRSGQLGATRVFSESLTATATYGRTRLSRYRQAGSTTSSVYSVDMTLTHPRLSLQLSAKQFTQPGALGDLTLQRDLRALVTYNATARWNLILSGYSTNLNDSYVGFELSRRNYVNLETVSQYLITPQWRLDIHLTDSMVKILPSVFNPATTSAGSRGGMLSITRTFGRTQIF